jgi:hypothetical protein
VCSSHAFETLICFAVVSTSAHVKTRSSFGRKPEIVDLYGFLRGVVRSLISTECKSAIRARARARVEDVEDVDRIMPPEAWRLTPEAYVIESNSLRGIPPTRRNCGRGSRAI